MTNEQKQQVRDALMRFVSGYPTQLSAASQLEGVSTSTISYIKNNKWNLVSDNLWQQVARQVGFYCGEWNAADTGAYMLLRILFGDAQHYAMAYGIAMNTGLGKTFTARHYAAKAGNAFYLSCTEGHNRKSFMSSLMDAIGKAPNGTVPEMMQQFTDYLSNRDEPLLIIDDAHKLKDRVLHFLVTLTNCLIGRCGIVIMGNDELRMRIIEGVRLNRDGYDLIYRSIGRRFITLGTLGPKDVELVCFANGIKDEDTINFIKDTCAGSLHEVSRLVQEVKMSAAA